MSRVSLFSILKENHYAEVSKDTIHNISEMLLNRTEKTQISLTGIIEKLYAIMSEIELDDSYNVTTQCRAEYITFICLLVKFFEPMMEQLDTIIDKEIIIHKIKEK